MLCLEKILIGLAKWANSNGLNTAIIRPLYFIQPKYGIDMAIIWPLYALHTAYIRPKHGHYTAYMRPTFGHYRSYIRRSYGSPDRRAGTQHPAGPPVESNAGGLLLAGQHDPSQDDISVKLHDLFYAGVCMRMMRR